MDKVSIKAWMEGYDLHLALINSDKRSITGDLNIVLPPGLETDHLELVEISLPAESEKMMHFPVRVSKEAMGKTKPIALDFEWDGKKKSDPINMKAALKWALNDPNVHTAIPGFTTFDQMELDLSVMEDLALTAQELKDLRLETKTGGLYCQQCEQCLPHCKQGLPIPDLMRSYMYAYGYNNLEAAHELVTSFNLPDNPCGNCRDCVVNCAKEFNVQERITDVSRLKNLPVDFFV